VNIDSNLSTTVVLRVVIDDDSLSYTVKTTELFRPQQSFVSEPFWDTDYVKKIVHYDPKRQQMLDPCLLILTYCLWIVTMRSW
jgi:hypothetical protein